MGRFEELLEKRDRGGVLGGGFIFSLTFFIRYTIKKSKIEIVTSAVIYVVIYFQIFETPYGYLR